MLSVENSVLIKQLNKNRILWHLLFWAFYLMFYTFQYGLFRMNLLDTFYNALFFLPVVILTTYVNIYYLLPKFLLKKKYKSFSILFIGCAFVCTLLLRLDSYYLIIPTFQSEKFVEGYQKISLFKPSYFFSHFISLYMVVVGGAFIKLLKEWYLTQHINQRLRSEKFEAELKFLKSQVHPHFLFNTLNNLLALTIKKSDKAPATVIKLSELLDFMLYKCNAEKIPLDKELKLIENYIELEKLRYDESLNIIFEVDGEPSNIEIAPLMILPFVENSFKHGVSGETEDAFINIKVEINSSLNINIVNSKLDCEEEDIAGYKEGIGFKNVKRRLELLYPKRHELIITDTKNKFSIMLNIETNEGNR